METKELKFPKYAQLAFTLLSLCIITFILYIGQNILIPLLLSFLFAILLNPAVNFLSGKLKFPRVIAVMVSVVLFILLLSSVILFISWQVSDITDDWNKIKHNLTLQYQHLQLWIRDKFHVSYFKQQSYVHNLTEKTFKGESELMGNTLSSFTDIIVNVLLIPVYTFLILLYRDLFIKFLHKVVAQKNEHILANILTQVKTVVQSYIVGLFIEMGIVAALTTGGLMIMGVQYAILLGVITAILNLIPYLGIIVAAVITILATLANSADLSLVLGIIILNAVVQLIDNNIIVPRVVGNKVRINAMASMVGVIIGGTVGGIPGMVLSIPLTAIIKVIFDHIEPLKAWGFLLGTPAPDVSKLSLLKKKLLPVEEEKINSK